MIGNDVVDLDDDDSRIAGRHPRFDERVVAPSERELVAEGQSGDRMRCLLWAAKESAYKLLRRRDRRLVFSPRRFVVRPAGAGVATVDVGGDRVAIRFELGVGFVHAIAREDGELAGEQLAGVCRRESRIIDDSEAVRRFAADRLAAHLGVKREELEFRREGRAPALFRSGTRIPGALSLSHHGRFVAFAWRGSSPLDMSVIGS